MVLDKTDRQCVRRCVGHVARAHSVEEEVRHRVDRALVEVAFPATGGWSGMAWARNARCKCSTLA
eukprot:14381476-Alexandrium_andersonii.AAC.1